MRTRWRTLVVLILVALVVAAVAGRDVVRSQFAAHQLARLAPGLDREIARHVVSDFDPEWLSYCGRIGLGPLGDAMQVLSFELRTTSYQEFLERRRPLESASLRIAQGFTQRFGFALPEQAFRHYMALSPERDFHLRQLERRYIEVAAATNLPADERIRIVDDLVEEFFASGDPNRAVLAYLVATRSELEAGRPDRHRARLVAGLRMARQYGQVYAVCQVLGELAAIHRREGHVDSLRLCLDEGIATALQHGLLDHAARLHKFYAGFHAGQGRLALALDHLAQAQRLCERPGGDSARLRLQIEYTKFVADLGCWDLVDRSLRRLPPLIREFPQRGREAEARKHAFDADRLRARLAFATGRSDQGSALMQRLRSAIPVVHRRVGLAEVFDDWSAGLERAGHPAEALEICGLGLVHCDTAHVPEFELGFRLRRVWLLHALDLTTEAEQELARADSLRASLPRRDKPVRREIGILRARQWFLQGRHAWARREIQQVFGEFEHDLADGDGGPLSYLELDEAVSLRDAVHEIERFTPEQGYDFEMRWRGLAAAAAGHRPASIPRGPGGVLPNRAIDGAHLVYRFAGNVLLRWMATRDAVVLDTIPMSPSQCLDNVREAIALLQSETPGSGQLLGRETLQSLRPLSALLLPPSLSLHAAGAMSIYVSADGPLRALPFEALPVGGPRDEQPLARRADVAYVRGWNPPARHGGSAVVVSNPTLSPELLRRHGWDRGLLESTAESNTARARWPGAMVLAGDEATREAVMRSWEGASIIYLAAHHVRDAEAPFFGFVPLANSPGTTSDAGFLEIADVHAMDLSSCRLAILASCASGAPYRMAVRPGVSLGDAVLDAGADAVVQSFWDVGDLETREFMKGFLELWREEGSDAAALNGARRRIMASANGAAPRVWAAWSVLVAMPRSSQPSRPHPRGAMITTRR